MSADKSAFKGYRDDQIGVGNEGNKGDVNEPGVYYDPQSGKDLEVFHPAAADAVVRMGWLRCEVERDEDGKITKIIKPAGHGRRPEDSEEILELRAKLEAAEAKLNKKPAAQKPKAEKDNK